jgi:hypothetical protein
MRPFIAIIENAQKLAPDLVRYMNGFCPDFALALLTLLPNPQEAELVCLGPDINGYDHVGVRLGDRYLDVRGSLSAEEFVDDGHGSYDVADIELAHIEAVEGILGLQAVPFPYEDIEEMDEAREAVRKVFGAL